MATREPGPVLGKNYIRREYLPFSLPRVDRRLPVGHQLHTGEPVGLAGAGLAIVERGVEPWRTPEFDFRIGFRGKCKTIRNRIR